MENKKAEYAIMLPVKGPDGAIASTRCTIRTPTIKLDREFRESSRRHKNPAFNAAQDEANIILKAIEALEKNLLGTENEADRIALTEAIAKAEARMEELQLKLVALDQDSYDRICRRVYNVINVPNASDGTPRTYDDIDWENANMEEVNNGLLFFRVRSGDLPKSALD